MYLSKVALDMTKRTSMLALQNPAMLHGAVERAFEPRKNRNLWRIDLLAGKRYLLLLSTEKPDLTGITEQFGVPGASETRDYTPLLDRISAGSQWQFRLCANPTYSTSQEGRRGKVHACTLTDQPEGNAPGTSRLKTQMGWLMHQAERNGFHIEESAASVTHIQWYSFSKGSGEQVKLLSVTYEGRLTVVDAEKFQKALTEGIGRGKAYGMGLLTVVRA